MNEITITKYTFVNKQQICCLSTKLLLVVIRRLSLRQMNDKLFRTIPILFGPVRMIIPVDMERCLELIRQNVEYNVIIFIIYQQHYKIKLIISCHQRLYNMFNVAIIVNLICYNVAAFLTMMLFAVCRYYCYCMMNSSIQIEKLIYHNKVHLFLRIFLSRLWLFC